MYSKEKYVCVRKGIIFCIFFSFLMFIGITIANERLLSRYEKDNIRMAQYIRKVEQILYEGFLNYDPRVSPLRESPIEEKYVKAKKKI